MQDQSSIVGYWPLLILGWPLVALAIASYLGGVVFKRAWMACAGAVLAVPFCVYIFMHSPAAGAVLLVSNVVAAWMVRRGRMKVAAVLLMPFVLLIALTAASVVRSF